VNGVGFIEMCSKCEIVKATFVVKVNHKT